MLVKYSIYMGFERPNWDEYFMMQAEIVKLRSNCMARKVGAIIVSSNRQLSTGYNGTPSGLKNCFDGGCTRCKLRMEGKIKSGEMLDRCLCNHAEANAILHCAMFGIKTSLNGCTLYTTLNPCLECTKMIITVGIKRIVCFGTYAESNHELLKQSNIELVIFDRKKIEKWFFTK